MTSKQKLELTWIGKEKRPKLEPRILLEDAEKSYHAKRRVSDKDIFDNRLIFGDNLLALKALEQEFTGKVKCVFMCILAQGFYQSAGMYGDLQGIAGKSLQEIEGLGLSALESNLELIER